MYIYVTIYILQKQGAEVGSNVQLVLRFARTP